MTRYRERGKKSKIMGQEKRKRRKVEMQIQRGTNKEKEIASILTKRTYLKEKSVYKYRF